MSVLGCGHCDAAAAVSHWQISGSAACVAALLRFGVLTSVSALVEASLGPRVCTIWRLWKSSISLLESSALWRCPSSSSCGRPLLCELAVSPWRWSVVVSRDDGEEAVTRYASDRRNPL
ncbi:hypothetical protein ABL78_8238 [Leptomonas seymouri]|uniref:Uncharacterized protein n=1 Tax=Leptomonas seymouri TaxID=5684 RepID=A0A0N1HYG1_LEPSE|nr:hypothetical protein ABL78_8238 [Leptomonas seymouri]|eukprot:KPI82750.1 hypothetical protein ABL78_8238 [Leptomonas seymouri]